MPRSAEIMRIYDGEGDRLMENRDASEKVILLPDTSEMKTPDSRPKLRIMWGQHLLEDVLDGRYASLVCGVNAQDNSRGIIAQVSALLRTSQWDHAGITQHARRLVQKNTVSVVKFDLDTVEVLGLLRPSSREELSLEDLAVGFGIVAQMISRKPQRRPSASVSFLGAQVNRLVNEHGAEPSFETVLRTMHTAGYEGDVYPAVGMWRLTNTGVFGRYPFPASLESMRQGGF
ncbi:MAG: hypothetical protein WD042_20420 [Phycisphaeraceae bacterium]